MLQSSFFDPVLGVDIHIVLVPTPAGPVPTPVPMPFVGMVFDPVGLAIGAAIGMATGGGPGLVLVNSMPVTNCGTTVTNMLTMPHLPVPGVAFAKGMPGNDAELFFGSLNVSLGGTLGVRLGDIALSCSDPVRLPTSVVLAIPKGMPVLNMPAMAPDLAGIAQSLLMAGAMRVLGAAARGGARLFRRLRAAQRRSRGWARVSRALRSVTDRIAPQRYRDRLRRAICFLTGHPVDVATGRVLTDNIDFALPGPLPLVFERVYSSSLAWRNGPLGYGWSHSLDQRVWLEPGKVVLLAEDGREIEFHVDGLPGRSIRSGQALYESTNRLTLRALGNLRWEIESADGVVREFAPVPGGNPQHAMLQRIRTGDGHHSIQLTYDAQGRLEWGRDCGGRLFAFVYDEQGHLVEVKLPLSRESGFYRHIKYLYGAMGDLVEVVDAADHSWKYHYQGHLLVQETDRTGLSFYFQYDGLGSAARCVRTWGDGGIYDHLITYDVQNRKTLVEDSLGATTVYQMDELGMVVKVVDAHGAGTEYAYDENCGALTEETDALGNVRATTYDEKGNVVAVTGPDGATVRVEYDGRGLPVRATDSLGGVWTWTYDMEGQLSQKVTPTGEWTAFGWKKGLLAWMEFPGGRRLHVEYDKHKNVSLMQGPNGAVTEYEYDGQGRQVRVKTPQGAILRYRHDVLGRLLRLESPSGVIQEMTLDEEGNLIEVRDATRHIRFKYGHFHKMVEREEAGTSIRFVHDTEGRLTGVVNESLEAYTYVLDACGRVLEETGFDGKTCRYERDALGQLTTRYLPSGRTTALTYDRAGRVVKVAHSDKTGVEFEYRADGALLCAKNENTEVIFERDALGRVIREVQGDQVVSSRFDATGERGVLETSLGARMAVVRDASGQVSALHLGQRGLRASQPAVRFERDALGLETARILGQVRVEWQRDKAGRPMLRRISGHAAGGVLHPPEVRTYQWNGENQIAAIMDSNRSPTFYQHDARGRLIGQRTDAEVLHRVMDVTGNVYKTPALGDRRYGRGGRLESADGARYVYDEDGNQTQRIEPGGHIWHYRWSGMGLLSEVERPDGTRVLFEYDALARRTRKLVMRTQRDGAEKVELETRFVWDGNNLLHELAATEVTTWYWEPNSFAPIAKEAGGSLWCLATDHLGTPTEMYDEMGQLAWRMQLDAFGVGKTDVALQSCPWRWPGQYEDEETRLYYNRYRHYDPQAGRYLSQDPAGFKGSLNLYAYTADPTRLTDPLGLAPCTAAEQAKFAKLAERVIDDARNGGRISLRHGHADSRHGFDEARIREILSNPDRVYVSDAKSRNLIFASSSGDIVVIGGTGAVRGHPITAYGPSGQLGTSGVSAHNWYQPTQGNPVPAGGFQPTDPGFPITHSQITQASPGVGIPESTPGNFVPRATEISQLVTNLISR